MGNEMTAPSEARLPVTWDHVTDQLEKEFPKGQCKERGHAIVLLIVAKMALDEAVAQAHEEGFWMSWESGHTGHTIGRVLQNEAGKAKHCNDCGELHVYPASAIRSAGSRA